MEKSKTSKLTIKTIIFDLDGTLIDTEPSAAQAVQDCFSEWKIKLDSQDAGFVTGRTWDEAFNYLFKKYSLPIQDSIAKKRIFENYRYHLDKSLTVVPGSKQAVKTLSTRFPLGLVSGSRRQEILWALDQLEIRNCFQIILGAEDYPRSKPNPDGYIKALGLLQAQPDSSLVFEDSTAGITSARSAGTWVAAVTSTNHFNQDLSLAHFRIPNLNCVNQDWVENLSFDGIANM